MNIDTRSAAWRIVLVVFLILASLYLAPGVQARPIHRPDLVYSPPIDHWRTSCIECPRNFYTMTDHSLRLDSDGQPHLAYGGDALYYAWYDGASWQSEIVDETATAGNYASLALDGEGHPHIGYFLNRPGLSEVRYAYKDATGWHIVTVDGTGQASGHTALALDALGYAHIVYYGNTALQYAYQDANGWHIQVADSKGWVGQYNSIAIDALGYPHVSYLDADDWDLRYAYQDASGWHAQTVANGGGQGTSLALDANGCPHITYLDAVDWTVKFAYQLSCPVEGGWQFDTIGPGGASMGSSALALDAQGYAHASYFNDNDYNLYYVYQDVAGWHTQVLTTGLQISIFVSLAWEENQGVHIAYNNGLGLIHTYRDPDGWEAQIVDRLDAVEESGPLLMDEQGNLHITYTRQNTSGVSYARRVAGNWQVQTLEGVAVSTAMTLDDQGYPHFCNADGGLNYTYQDASGFHSTMVDENGSGMPCSIAVDRQHYPHIIYYSYAFHDEWWRYTYQDTSGWHFTYLDISGDYSLVLDATDHPYILNTAAGAIYYQDSSGWHTNTFDSGYFQYGALALDTNGYAHVSYYDPNARDLRYAHQDVNGWHAQTIDDVGDPGKFTDIAVDADGYPHISYHDNDFPYTGNLKYAYQDASGWHIQTIDNAYSIGNATSIVLDTSGKPYISYHNQATSDLLLAFPLLNPVYMPIILKNNQQP